jgi:hypothetical protein
LAVYNQRFVFVGGLHRSGTTAVAEALGSHDQISGLQQTGVPMDEGQHLQSAYPAARELGGPGLFGFSQQAHLTEESPLASARTREALQNAWRPFWDMTRPVLLEKSPPNLVRMRFLQAVFPEARFLAVVRHPVPVALATRRFTKASPETFLRHWAVCHELLLEDAPYIENLLILRYEDIVAAPAETLGRAVTFLGLNGDLDVTGIEPGRNESYFSRWKPARCTIDAREADTAAQFGYNTRDPGRDLPVSPQVEKLMQVRTPD